MPRRQTDLVSVERVSSILHDDVGVRFEDRNDLLCSRNRFAVEDATRRLFHDTLNERKVLLDHHHEDKRSNSEDGAELVGNTACITNTTHPVTASRSR